MENTTKDNGACQHETLVSGSKLRISDLRAGNVLSYTTSEGEVADAIIDWQDLKWLDEDPKGFNSVHKPIELSWDILKTYGFDKKISRFGFSYNKEGVTLWTLYSGGLGFLFDTQIIEIKCLHQLQNLYFALTGKELKLDR